MTERIEQGEQVTVVEISQIKKDYAEQQQLLEAVKKQRDEYISKKQIAEQKWSELKSNFDEEKAKEVNAALIIERENTSAQIQAQKDAVEKAKQDMQKLKDKHKKSINNEVKQALAAMQNEINQNQFQIDESQKRVDELKQQEQELNKRVGAVARHKKAIGAVKKAIESVFIPVFDIVDDTDFDVPEDVQKQWGEVYEAAENMLNTLDSVVKGCAKPVMQVVNE